MAAIVEHLYDLGHRRIAFVSQHLAEHAGERRRLGFAAALARRDLAPVALANGATAVVAHNDMLAIATIDQLERNGRRVPRDVSVVGYDNNLLSRLSTPTLSTVQQDIHSIGQHGFRAEVLDSEGNCIALHSETAN